MTPTQKLRQCINEACPELLELSFGCEFVDKIGGRTLIYICKWHSEKSCLASWIYDGGYGEVIRADVNKILGHPPKLNHLLMALGKSYRKVQGWIIEDVGDGVEIKTSIIQDKWWTVIKNYDLTKDPLDQTEEVKEQLLELLEK